MEEVLPQLLAFPPRSFSSETPSDAEYDQHIRLLLQFVNQQSTCRLLGNWSIAAGLFEVIEPFLCRRD